MLCSGLCLLFPLIAPRCHLFEPHIRFPGVICLDVECDIRTWCPQFYPTSSDIPHTTKFVAGQVHNNPTTPLFDHQMPRVRAAMGGAVMKLERRDSFRLAHPRQTLVRCASYDFTGSTTMTTSTTSPTLTGPTTPQPFPIDLSDRGEEGYYVRVQGYMLKVSDCCRLRRCQGHADSYARCQKHSSMPCRQGYDTTSSSQPGTASRFTSP